jgi:CheY-like chemotaxis protein
MGIPILIVNDHPSTRKKMQQSLEASGFTTLEADNTESGLATLRESEGSMVVLFNVALFDNCMAGTDGITLLGAVASDKRLAQQHAFVIVTPTPEQVETALGRLLNNLSVPILAEPFDTDELLRAISVSTRRLLVSA